MSDSIAAKFGIRKKTYLLLMLTLFVPCIITFLQYKSNDVWFILSHGKYVIENGIPFIEPLTLHKGFTFVMQQWLTAVLFRLIYNGAGMIGLQLLTAVCHGFIVLAFYKLCMRVSEGNFFASYLISMPVSIFLIFCLNIRPYTLTILIIAAELCILEGYIAEKNIRRLFALPVLSLLLVNLHASMWPMMFVILVPYFFESVRIKLGGISLSGYDVRPLSVTAAAMIFAGLVNPYGIDSMTYLFRSYGTAEISALVYEMRPADVNTGTGKFIFGVILSVVCVYCFYRKGKTTLRYALLTLGTAYMTLSAVRSFALFLICGTFPLAYTLKSLSYSPEPQISKKILMLRKVLASLIILTVPVIAFGTFISAKQVDGRYEKLTEVVQLVQAEDKDVTLYTGYDDGGMAEFYGIPAYLDPRAEVFLKQNNKQADILKEYCDMQSGRLGYRDVLNKYAFTHLIVSNYDILAKMLPRDSDYMIAYSNSLYTLYEKREMPKQ